MAQRGPYAKIPTRDRERLIELYTSGGDWQKLGQLLGISRQTVRNIIIAYINHNRVGNLPRGGPRRLRLSANIIDSMLEFVGGNPAATLEQIRADAPDVNLTTISRALDGRLITLKLLRQVPMDWNAPVTKEARRMHIQWLMEEGSLEHLIYMDEFGVNL